MCGGQKRHGTKDDQHNETAALSLASLSSQGSYCQSDKPFQSLINNSKNKRHKSCLLKHLCFPRKSKFIETKSSACSTLFFQTGTLLRPESTDVFHLFLSRYPEYTKLFCHPFETLKIKVGKKHNKPFRACAAARGRHSPRISRDMDLSPQAVQRHPLHTQ